MAFNTNNPVGSTDPRDLYDNAGNLDNFVNGDAPFYPDRLGKQRLSYAGMEQDFGNAQDGRKAEFDEFLEASSFVWIGDYGAGLTFTSRSQYTVRDGQAYRLANTATIPYTTTGNWPVEQVNFNLVNSDDVLRQDLLDHTDPANGAGRVGRATRQINSIAELRTVKGRYNGDLVSVLGYYADTPGVGTKDRYWVSDSTKDDNGGSVIAVTGEATGRWEFSTSQGVWAEDFGARNDGTDTAGTTAAIWAAIRSLRKNPKSIIQYIGGPTVTGYESGVVNFGVGVFAHAADTFNIEQDLGLTLRGQGGRGMSQAIYAPTTLLQKGVSSGFSWRHFGNAGRALRFENIDICYEGSDFTGDVIDTMASPDLYIGPGCRVGCVGGTMATRVQSAKSCIRATHPERVTIDHAVPDGAGLGVWPGYSRQIAGSNLGGWGMMLTGVTFYDFTGSHISCGPSRLQFTLGLRGCNFNPINVSPSRCLDLQNVEGLEIDGCIFTPSTTSQPTTEYLSVLSCTGSITNNVFLGAASKVGTIGGANPSCIDWSRNSISCAGGLTVTGGVFTGKGNEYATADNGVDIVPVASVSLDIGPDVFKSGVSGNSYRIPADSAFLAGRINYAFEQDNSNSKYASASTRVTMGNLDRRFISLGAAGTTLSPYAAGRTYNVTVAGTQTLPTPIPGTKPIRILKSGANALTIAATAGTTFVVGANGSRSSATATAGDVGSMIEFEALSPTTWVARVLSGNWSFT